MENRPIRAMTGQYEMLVLTGASGFVGSQLLPLLVEAGVGPILLVSRDAEALAAQHPGIACCDYEQLQERDLAGAVVVHLAARNNDRHGTLAEFKAANVDHLLQIADAARRQGAARFINLSSSHALGADARDNYGVSKREGARKLTAAWPEGAINLYLPAVYGDKFKGRLAPLGKLPGPVRALALSLLRQAKPVVSIETLAGAVLALVKDENEGGASGRCGDPLFLADRTAASGLYPFAKRAMDLLAAAAVAVLLGWAIVVIITCIRLDSTGPAIFAQPRVGRHGKLFVCYKFRTMKVGTKQLATHELSGTSVTRVGAFLRRTKLDELPQIVNIFRNEMSLVGPRPCLPNQAQLVAEREQRAVLEMKPGITGLAQINDIDMSDPRRLAIWDARYMAFRNLALDIHILLRTLRGSGSGDRVSTEATAARTDQDGNCIEDRGA
jgi:lipopolysaccharide/colanic/teichoic acid biosynthesis glycosyltransferase/uncharacterized protein YbjT (DUF2867 family)